MSRGPHDTGRDDVPCRCSECRGGRAPATPSQAHEIVEWVETLPDGAFRRQQEKGLGLTA